MSIIPIDYYYFFNSDGCLLSHGTLAPGAYHNKTDDGGLVLPSHELFSSVVATILVIVVTAQVI